MRSMKTTGPDRRRVRDGPSRTWLGTSLVGISATSAYALPFTLHDAAAPIGAIVHLHIRGEAGGDWSLAREPAGWRLAIGAPATAAARVDIDQERAWRLFTKGITSGQAQAAATL